jgi:hypothetical protein
MSMMLKFIDYFSQAVVAIIFCAQDTAHEMKLARLVEHLVRDEGVAGSNPATPTNT